jgi:O-methyltransferase domain/IclR helix-turn-helix domain
MTLTEPAEATAALPPPVQVYVMWQGALVTRMMRTVAEYGVTRLLADGPRATADLARTTGLHAPSLHRVLRALTGLGLVRTDPDGWALTTLGEATLEIGHPPWADAAVDQLPHAVETGKTGMELAHGCSVFEYFARNPEDAAAFDRGLPLITAGVPQAVAEAYDFAGIRELVDVGGGTGTLLAEVLQRHAAVRGVLFDLPRTIAHVTPALQRFADRCEAVGGDFFEAVPAGADAYMLSHVVHDWPEERCLTILRNVRTAMAPDGRLLIAEMIVPPGDEPHPAKMQDMMMLVISGGMERTEEEYAELLARAGFRLDRVIPTRSPVSVLEARPV